MELLKEDKTLKASQRETGAGLGKRTEQREEITRRRAEIRGGVRQGQGGRLGSPQALQDSAFLSLVYLSFILKGRKEAIFVVYLKGSILITVSVPENIATFAGKSNPVSSGLRDPGLRPYGIMSFSSWHHPRPISRLVVFRQHIQGEQLVLLR